MQSYTKALAEAIEREERYEAMEADKQLHADTRKILERKKQVSKLEREATKAHEWNAESAWVFLFKATTEETWTFYKMHVRHQIQVYSKVCNVENFRTVCREVVENYFKRAPSSYAESDKIDFWDFVSWWAGTTFHRIWSHQEWQQTQRAENAGESEQQSQRLKPKFDNRMLEPETQERYLK